MGVMETYPAFTVVIYFQVTRLFQFPSSRHPVI